MTRNLLIAALMFLLLSTAGAVTWPDDRSFSAPKAPRVTVAPVPPVVLTPGKPAKVEVAFRVEAGFHINSNQPKNDLLIPTVLRLTPPSDVIVSKVNYPAGRDMTFEFLPDEKLNVYTGDFAISGMVTTARKVSPGTYRVHGVLKYQACDNRQCYAPKELPVDFDVKVRKAPRPPRRNPGQSPHVHQ